MTEQPATRDKFDFPDCMHALAAAFHMQGIDPSDVTIRLPHDKWWDLYSALERRVRGFMLCDPRQPLPRGFRYMGFFFTHTDQGGTS